MSEELYEITFDFSKYFKNPIIFKEKSSPDSSIDDIITKSNNLSDEMKVNLKYDPPSLSSNGRIIFSSLSLKDNEIKNGNTIFVKKTNKKKKRLHSIKNNNTILYSKRDFDFEENNLENTLRNPPKNFFTKKIWISLGIIFGFALLITVILIIVFKFINKKNDLNLVDYSDEKLLSKLDYKDNQVYNLLNIKKLSYEYKFNKYDGKSNENKTYLITEYVHYTLGIEKEFFEINEKTKIKKKLYHAFLGINNLTIENGTNIIINLYLNNLNK